MKIVKIFLLVFMVLFLVNCSDDSSTSPDNGNKNNGVSIAIRSYYDRAYHSLEIGKYATCTVLVTDNKGNPLPSKRVDWEIIKGEGSLVYQSNVTDDYGISPNYVYNVTSDEIQLQASVFGYDASVIITLTEFE